MKSGVKSTKMDEQGNNDEIVSVTAASSFSDAAASSSGCNDGICVPPKKQKSDEKHQSPHPSSSADSGENEGNDNNNDNNDNNDNNNMNKINIDIISDTMCPWCWVGKRNFETALLKYNQKQQQNNHQKIEAEVNWIPYFLDKNLPQVGKPVKEYYKDNYGDADAGERMKSPLIKAGKKCGIDFETHYVKLTHYRPTILSHRLIEYAKTNSNKQNDMVEELFQMYYERGKHLNSIEDLVEAAMNVGFDGDIVRPYLQSHDDEKEIYDLADHHKSAAQSGVPTFIFTKPGTDLYYTFSGGQPPTAFEYVFNMFF